MTYTVLARKWRPTNFTEMVGQEHILQIMSNSLQKNRLHHAYLLCGTRGVGKTTLARIFAKCLNCESGITATPCNTCPTCQQIDKGQFIDLIEIDAASRTKVEDTRDLLDNVQYAPSNGRFKVYLIDEVHMLSGHSFNALLKTLEEPPAHVKFLLATTDPQKLPVTVLSRCLKLQLNILSVEQIKAHLEHILETEKIPFEPGAITHIANAACGSVRDSLSLLDQAIAFGGEKVTSEKVSHMLGLTSDQVLWDLLTHVQNGQAQLAMATVRELAQSGCDFPKLCDALLSMLYHVALFQQAPDALPESTRQKNAIEQFAKICHPEQTQLSYQIILKGKIDLIQAPSAQIGFEMILLRLLAFRPQKQTVQKNNLPVTSTPKAASSPEPTSTQAIDITQDNWPNIVNSLDISGMTKMLANHCSVGNFTNHSLQLHIDGQHQGLNNTKQAQLLEVALEKKLGRKTALTIRAEAPKKEEVTPMNRQRSEQKAAQSLAHNSLAKDVQLNDLMQLFDGHIDDASIETIKN
jgi:DNA polymerase III subunit gamma/tau